MVKEKKRPLIVKIFVIFYIFSVLLVINWGYNVYKYSKIEVKTNLTQEEKDIIASEFDLNFDSSIIQGAYYDDGSIIVNVGPFETKEALLECFKFKYKTLYRRYYKKLDEFYLEYNNYKREEVTAIKITSSEELISEHSFYVYIYEEEGVYYFELEKWNINKKQKFDRLL